MQIKVLSYELKKASFLSWQLQRDEIPSYQQTPFRTLCTVRTVRC